MHIKQCQSCYIQPYRSYSLPKQPTCPEYHKLTIHKAAIELSSHAFLSLCHQLPKASPSSSAIQCVRTRPSNECAVAACETRFIYRVVRSGVA
ncbi:hypothetical protein BAUCODRAFT_352958 [Baudoinia panamericana UAMH 10762]|uniref:Uncharacterized protein n=1 Tax=Baudoinia panamericana (strain UAMH 10762) TaxID=717646 RepID=M2N6X0_BAUPA|nr:uncharacterized protein BAUCODRAFT_352958 [Baudoinia panamericana UAMH 10762]EMC99853.1 hypothetical protein BAUCODRAFT_352958 [Baudoinia panamericana UAMH 10762]